MPQITFPSQQVPLNDASDAKDTANPRCADAVFPFGAHKGNTIAHVACVDKEHLAYFAGKYANYKRKKWLKTTHPEFFLLLEAYCLENEIGTAPNVQDARTLIADSRYRRW